MVSYFSQADSISLSVAVILLVMSVSTWYLVFLKLWQRYRFRRDSQRFLEAFWNAPHLNQAVPEEHAHTPMARLASAGIAAARHYDQHAKAKLSEHGGVSEFVTRALRQALSLEHANLETGLTTLASIGSTAPFVGLFGTVWGVYHALVAIGQNGQAAIEKVAGPVGEALIMTGAGLAVAIPGVLAYNYFTRANRIASGQLDGFAHDLHALLATGAPLQRATAAPKRVLHSVPNPATENA
jgi:biopolymer transport protein ExbB